MFKLQFSLRSLVVVLTVLCAWIAFRCNRARVQMEAIDSLERLGVVVYCGAVPNVSANHDCIMPLLEAGQWQSKRRFIDSLMNPVTAVTVGLEFRSLHLKDRKSYFVRHGGQHLECAIPELKRLPSLRTIYIVDGVDIKVQDKIKESRPDCRFVPVLTGVAFYDVDD